MIPTTYSELMFLSAKPSACCLRDLPRITRVHIRNEITQSTLSSSSRTHTCHVTSIAHIQYMRRECHRGVPMPFVVARVFTCLDRVTASRWRHNNEEHVHDVIQLWCARFDHTTNHNTRCKLAVAAMHTRTRTHTHLDIQLIICGCTRVATTTA
jgi:hypothetical protein